MSAPTVKPWRRRTLRPRRPDVAVVAGEMLAQITIYPDITLLTRRIGRAWRQHPVSPAALAETLARVPTASGLLPPHTLGVGRLQGEPFAVQYVPPRVVTLRMERARYRIPLPPLIVGGWQTDYRIFAYAGDGPPTSDRAPLAIGPFPNLYADGRICWGSSDPRPKATPQTLTRALDLFLTGSLFNLHLAQGKSVAFPNSVPALWKELRRLKATEYPVRDLVPASRTLADLLSGRVWGGGQ